MSWEYRVAMKKFGDSYEFGVIEVYYGNTSNILQYWTEKFQEPYGETPEEVRSDMKLMSKAFNKPVLNYNAMKAGLPITDFEFEDNGVKYE